MDVKDMAARETFLSRVVDLFVEHDEWFEAKALAVGGKAPHGGEDRRVRIETRTDSSVLSVVVTPLTVAAGYRDIGPHNLPEERVKRLRAARRANDASRLDHEDANVLVQLGLWGEVRYT